MRYFILISLLLNFKALASLNKEKAQSELKTLKDELFVEEIAPEARERLREQTAQKEKTEFDDLEATYFSSGGKIESGEATSVKE